MQSGFLTSLLLPVLGIRWFAWLPQHAQADAHGTDGRTQFQQTTAGGTRATRATALSMNSILM